MKNDPPTKKKQTAREWLLAGLTSLGVSLAIVAPFWWLGTASGHDIQFHISSWLEVAGQWKEGILFPRWAEWANYGFGEPRFVFYPPLSWMLGAGLGSFLPWNAIPAMFVVVVQTFAGISAYALARRFVLSFSAALLGAAAYAANPYALLIIYQRSDYAELLAISFFPLLLVAALRVCGLVENDGRERKNIVWFGILFAAVWLSNAPAGVLASYSVALLFAWVAATQRTFTPILRGTGGLALGFGLASFYLIPAAYEQRWVNISGALASGLTPADNFLFARTPDTEHDAFNRIASAIAVLLMAWTFAVGAALWRSEALQEGAERRNIFRSVLLLSAAASVMMVRVTLPLWMYLPKLRFVQFPWRWMSLLAVAFALFAATLGARRRAAMAWVATAMILVGTGTYLAKHAWWDTEDMPAVQDSIEESVGFEGTDEYDPLGDDHTDIPQKQQEVVEFGKKNEPHAERPAEVRVVRWTAEERIVLVKARAAVKIRLRLLNYPAWEVRVNGAAVTPERTESYKAMVIPLLAGDATVEVRFARTTDRAIGGLVSLQAALASLLIFLWPAKKEQG